jgi:CBS domain-containing protein
MKMTAREILHEPMLSSLVSGRVVGIISRADVIRALLHIESLSSTQDQPVSSLW